ncbi:MAG: hypothetical protein GX800_08475 [Clostridiaceae bacterium]|nr:hypothetical protein [Clostridiaceae bacterium]
MRLRSVLLWITGSSTPCLSIFKPIIFGKCVPPVFADEKDSFDYWSKREYLNRAIFSDYIDVNDYRRKAYAMEDEFIKEFDKLEESNSTRAILTAICEECSNKEQEFVDSYKDIIEGVKYNQLKLKGKWHKRTKLL